MLYNAIGKITKRAKIDNFMKKPYKALENGGFFA